MSKQGLCGQCQRLATENADLRRTVKRQRAALKKILALTWLVIDEAGRVMAIHQPRGTWSLHRGRAEVAKRVQDLLADGMPSGR